MNNNKTLLLGISDYKPEGLECIKIIATSWNDPQTYHVIGEDGEFDSTSYLGEYTKEMIKQVYEIDIDAIEDPIYKIIKENPNDHDLGKKIRSLYNSLKYNNEKND
jgi:hypothetical protein